MSPRQLEGSCSPPPMSRLAVTASHRGSAQPPPVHRSTSSQSQGHGIARNVSRHSLGPEAKQVVTGSTPVIRCRSSETSGAAATPQIDSAAWLGSVSTKCDVVLVTAPKPISSPSVPIPSVGWVGSHGSSPIRHASTGSPTSVLRGSPLAQGRVVTSPRRMVSSCTGHRLTQNPSSNGFTTPTTCPGSGNLSTDRRRFATQPSASPPPDRSHRATLSCTSSTSSRGGLAVSMSAPHLFSPLGRGAPTTTTSRRTVGVASGSALHDGSWTSEASPQTPMVSWVSEETSRSPGRQDSQFNFIDQFKIVKDLEGRALLLEERYHNLMRLGDALVPGRECQSATVGDARRGRITESRMSEFERRLKEIEVLVTKAKPQHDRAESVERRLEILESVKASVSEEPKMELDFIARMEAAAKEAMKAAAEAASAAEAVAAVTAGCRDKGWLTSTDDERNDAWDSVAASSQPASSEEVSSSTMWRKPPSSKESSLCQDSRIGRHDTPDTHTETDGTDDPTLGDTPRQRSLWQLEACEFPEVASEQSDHGTEPNPKDRFGEPRHASSTRGSLEVRRRSTADMVQSTPQRSERRRGHARQ